jgi:hypothetical protein
LWHDAAVVDDARDSWQDWAARADFIPFEPVGDQVEAIWTGGFGGAPGYTGHLQIQALVEGFEVSVDTVSARRHPDGTRRWIGEAPVGYLLIRVELSEPLRLHLEPCGDRTSLARFAPNQT